MTYRASPADGSAWVTGASSGVGRAVALELARRGYLVVASARRSDALQALARDAAGLAGRIEPHPVDVTDRDAMAKAVAEIESRGPIALAFLNAGGSFADAAGDFGGEGFRQTFELNVFGVVNGLNPVMRAMKPRGKGQIAINGRSPAIARCRVPAPTGRARPRSSIWRRAPNSPAIGTGSTIQIVNHGFVRTALTADNKRPMPAHHGAGGGGAGGFATDLSAPASRSPFRAGSLCHSRRRR